MAKKKMEPQKAVAPKPEKQKPSNDMSEHPKFSKFKKGK